MENLKPEKLEEQLNILRDNLLQVRKITQQRIDVVGNAVGFQKIWEQNKKSIRDYFKSNNRLIEDVLEPLLDSERILSADEVIILSDFCDKLLVSWPEADLDLTLHFHISKKLYEQAIESDDGDEIIKSCNRYLNSCYINLVRVNRIRGVKEYTEYFKNQGLSCARITLSYLDHNKFMSLKDELSRSIIFSDARFYLALYDTWYATDETENEERIDGLVRALDLAEDDWYVSRTEKDWKRFKIRTLEHMGQLTENGNQWQMTPHQCQKIMVYMQALKQLWTEDEEYGNTYLPRVQYELIIARNSFYSNNISLQEYRTRLLEIYHGCSTPDYDMYSVIANIFVPCEYLKTIDKSNIDEDQIEILKEFSANIANYVLKFKGGESFSFLLEYTIQFLENFIEFPGGSEFEELVFTFMAALYPPVYITALQSANVAKIICHHIIRTRPESFVDEENYIDIESVLNNRDKIEQRIYHGTLLRQAGKLFVMDTIISSARKHLFPEDEVLKSAEGMSAILFEDKPNYVGTLDFVSLDPFPLSILRASERIVTDYESGTSLGKIIYDIGTDSYELRELFSHPEAKEDLATVLSRRVNEYYMDIFLRLKTVYQKDNVSLEDALEGYVIRTGRIRELSTPQIDVIKTASDWESIFKEQFKEIGLMAGENKRILSGRLYPLLNSEKGIDEENAKVLQDFCQTLLNGQDLGDIDQGLVYLVSKRLLEHAFDKGDDDFLVRQLDMHISSCYEMAHQAKRMSTATAIVKDYRNEGLRAAETIWGYMDKDKFAALSDESKELVLINSRYAVYLYETIEQNEKINDMYVNRLLKAASHGDNPFYVKEAPEYDWNYHRIRSLEYLGQSTECGNARGFTKSQCQKIADNMRVLRQIWESNPSENEDILPYASILLMLYRSMYFAGEIDINEYRDNLRKIYDSNKNDKYDFNSIFPNLVVPLEIIITYEKQGTLSREEEDEIIGFYIWVIGYVTRARNQEAFSLLLEYFSVLIYHFIEIEGKFSFEQMGLYCMAALHPPTYIHSQMVGVISRAICEALLDERPELFIKTCGCEDIEDVKNSKEKILEYLHHGALCHDFGKIPMIDTIFLYGRNLLDHEFALLKHHPQVGGELLKAHDSTACYTDIAVGHHKWYDDSRGYPETFEGRLSQVKIFSDIVCMADCMDAATDGVGRSYSGSKTAEDIIEEFLQDAGTRYNPVIAEILSTPAMRKKLNTILFEERNRQYLKTYNLLNNLLENGIASDHIRHIRVDFEDQIHKFKSYLKQEEYYKHACRLVSYDMQTACPKEGIKDQGDLYTFLSQEAYKIRASSEFSDLLVYLYGIKEHLDPLDQALIISRYKDYLREKNMTADFHREMDMANKQAYVSWQNARESKDYRLFMKALKKRIIMERSRMSMFDDDIFPRDIYDRLMDEYESGLTSEMMDRLFKECIPVITELTVSAAEKSKSVRTDFLERSVTDAQQEKLAQYILEVMGFDKSRGVLGLTVHPFTEGIAKDDVRVTTHFEDNFLSSMYSVIHECGHALFEQNQSEENFKYYISNNKTMGMHESVSRFYENIIGRSREFIHFMYPRICEIFPQVMNDVSEDELYNAINLVRPSLIRTDADELTYSLHVYIRYEMEKALIHGEFKAEEAEERWNELYEKYLGVRPSDSLSGILQDIHWTDSFGYFPTYVLGNFYGCMYLNTMLGEFDVFSDVSKGDFSRLNKWMTDHVFAEADRLSPKEWIKSITGREITSKDFVEYLKNKY